MTLLVNHLPYNRPNDCKLQTPQVIFWGRFACQSLTLLKLKNAFCLPNKGSKNEGWPHRSCFGKHDSFHFAISRPCVTIITAAATQFWLLLVLADHELLFSWAPDLAGGRWSAKMLSKNNKACLKDFAHWEIFTTIFECLLLFVCLNEQPFRDLATCP